MTAYWYELLYRGVSPGAMPRDSIAAEHSHINSRGFQFGAVAYNRELTPEEIDNYELKPIDPVRELYDYELIGGKVK